MTTDDIRRLLAAAMAYDNRKPGEAAVAAWTEAAHRAGWTFDDALEAIHTHYAESAQFVMPGHITERIRIARRQPAPYTALPPAQPASEEHRERMKALVGAHFALPDDIESHRPQPGSPGHQAARERARRQLDRIRKDQPA